MNVMDYLDWRGDLTFAERGFNEIDNLIFSVLSYIEMEDFVDADGEKIVTIEKLHELYTEEGRHTSMQFLTPEPLLEKAAQSDRFKDVKVAYYVSEIDHDNHSQMAAVTFLFSQDEVYVAFRGTDSTIVGWREDFNLSFLNETPGQHDSVRYLERVAGLFDGKLIVGGHSKGGNFAVYASAFCDEKIRDDRIVQVYCNDGPGFKTEITEREGFAEISDKVIKLVPGSSPVGILLEDMEERRFIKSTGKGLMQHDPYSWCLTCTHFEDADERSQFSLFVDNVLSNWLSGMENEERRTLVDTFFDALMINGAKTITDLSNNKLDTYRSIIKALKGINAERKSEVVSSLQKLFVSGFETMKSGALYKTGGFFIKDHKV